jgi:restriction endonuclease S subunit
MIFYKETNFKETPIGKIPKDWNVFKLSELAEDVYYGITAKAVEKETELRMLRTTDIKDYSVNWDTLPFCEITEKRQDVQRFLLKKNDLIIARAGTTGISILVDKEVKNVIFGSYLIKVQLSKKVYPKFMHYFCQSNLYWNHITSSQAGSTLKNISLPVLKSLNIPLPSLLLEQQKIAEILSTVDEAVQKTNEIIAKTERLKKGLMQELLTKGLILGFMFDTNIFDEILDEKIELPENLRYYVTHIQYDEICNIPIDKKERREKLLKIFNKVPKEVIATEGAVLGVSRLELSKLMSKEDAELYDKMLKKLEELDEKSGKKKTPENQARDILIALTCMKNCLTLVTNDNNLKKVAQEFQCSAITFEQLLKGEYREFKDTEIGRIPKEWMVLTAEEICGRVTDGTHETPRPVEKGFYLITSKHLRNGEIHFYEAYFISESDFNEVNKRSKVDVGDVLFSMIGTVGLTAVVKKEYPPFAIKNVGLFKTKGDLTLANWLHYYFQSSFSQKYINDNLKGTTQKYLPLYALRKFPVILPSYQEKQRIVNVLLTVDKKLEIERKEKAKLEKIKQGLMDLLLTGKIRIKVN